FGHVMMQPTLLTGCLNRLPAFPMDRGRILRAALATRLSYLRATWWAATIAKFLCVIGVAIAVFHEPLLDVLFGFIFMVGELEYRAVKRRELEDAHMRALLARVYLSDPPIEEPPILSR